MKLSERLVNLIVTRQATDKDLEGIDPQDVFELKSNPDVPQFFSKSSAATVVDDEKRVLRHTWTDESIDDDGDLIALSGWESNLGRYLKNPAVMWAHGRVANLPPIAKTVKMGFEHGVTPKSAWADFEYAPKDAFEFADTIYQLAKGGFVKATSAGFRVLAVNPLTDEVRKAKGIGPYGIWTLQQRLYEISQCCIGNNENTLRRELEKMVDAGTCTDKTRREFEKAVPLTERDWANHLKEACDSFFDMGRFKVVAPTAGTSGGSVLQFASATLEALDDSRVKALEVKVAAIETSNATQVAALLDATNKSTEVLGKLVPALSDLTKRIALMGGAPGGSQKPDASAPDARASVTPTTAVKDAGDALAERLKQSLLPK